MAKIFVNNKFITRCIGDLSECPEDATWGRSLQDIFWAGVTVGRLAKSDEEIRIDGVDE